MVRNEISPFQKPLNAPKVTVSLDSHSFLFISLFQRGSDFLFFVSHAHSPGGIYKEKVPLRKKPGEELEGFPVG